MSNIWTHKPGHKEFEGNDKSDQLVNEGVMVSFTSVCGICTVNCQKVYTELGQKRTWRADGNSFLVQNPWENTYSGIQWLSSEVSGQIEQGQPRINYCIHYWT